MREAAFVKWNTEKWTDIERNPTRDPDELTARYVELTDDLSYARTFYPESKVTRYLNGLAAQMHRGLMQNKREDRGRFVSFWTYELPTLFYHSHRTLAVSAVFFGIACLIGWISAVNDPTFVRLILGDEYVNMTIENIKKGNPLGVYGGSDQASMFFQITLNNIGVSLRAFVAGVVASVGTLVMLFYNGVMLGAFQAFFYERGLLTQSLLKIWIHGTLEISAIVIAGAAGLTLGNGLLFPGTLPRLESFKRGAKQGLKIAVGLVPIFIAAGFLESFVTRMTLPPVVSVLIIGTSGGVHHLVFCAVSNRLHRSSSNA